jgi:ribonuclease Y
MKFDYSDLIVGLITLVIGAIVVWITIQKSRMQLAAERRMLQETKERMERDHEDRHKDVLLQLKDEALQMHAEVEQETRTVRADLQRLERRLIDKEEVLEQQRRELQGERDALHARDHEIKLERLAVGALSEERRAELVRIAHMTEDDARSLLRHEMEAAARHEASHLIHQIEEEARVEGQRRARNIVTLAIQRLAIDHVSETTVSVVPLPSDDVKGRIIGREGRNIRAFETLTGVDVIIDDTPEAVVLSAFDPVRREIAKIALTNLIIDGRIHPIRIEEMVTKAQEEVEQSIRTAGEEAILATGVTGLHPELMKLVGKMKYRLSYGQNLLDHSIEVCHIGASLAAELGADLSLTKRACLLHDLGKVVADAELPHALVSRDLMLRYGEDKAAAHAAGAHHNDLEHERIEDVIVQLADAISAARPGARREQLDSYIKRLQKLETIAESFEGVEKTYAVQAGRELRLMVKPELIDDARALKLARDIAQRIESEMEFPGQIKVTVIRETRAIDYAR